MQAEHAYAHWWRFGRRALGARSARAVRWASRVRLGLAVLLPGLVAAAAVSLGGCGIGTGEQNPDQTELRMRVVSEDGLFLVYDAAIPADAAPRKSAGYLAYWNDYSSRQAYIFQRLLFSPQDVGHALLNLERDFGTAVDSLAGQNRLLEQGLQQAAEVAIDPTLWADATEQIALAVMGRVPASGSEVSTRIVDSEECLDFLPPKVVLPPLEPPPLFALPKEVMALAIRAATCDDGGGCNWPDCDDGDVCTREVKHCDGRCDHNPLTGGLCELPNLTECEYGECTNGICEKGLYLLGPCTDDGNECTEDICINGVCSHPPNTTINGERICTDDGNECTDDVCSVGTCTHPPIDGNPDCEDDGNECTNDICSNGLCDHPPRAGSCTPDSNPCTDDICSGTTCAHPTNTAPCDDGNACTTNDRCSGGGCSGTTRDCDDVNACTDDSCSKGSGCVHADIECDDGDPCTVDSCDPGSGCDSAPLCVPPQICCDGACCANAEECCGDGLFCNGPETCSSGSCQPGTPPCPPSKVCNETAETCDDCSTSADCDDGKYCNGSETCAAGNCQTGTDPCPDSLCDDDLDACVECLGSGECVGGAPCTDNNTCINGTCGDGTPIDCDEVALACEGLGTPNTGETEIPGSTQTDLTICLPPEGSVLFNEADFAVTHRIITHDTERTRSLHGLLKLTLVSGDSTIVDLLWGGNPYTLGSPIPVIENGHSGCGLHDYHDGTETFTVLPRQPGQVTLRAQVDPEPECCEGDGVPTVEAEITIQVVDPVDLAFGGLADADEVTIGAFLCVNNDDDNGNGTADKDDVGPTVGEDDLMPVTITLDPARAGSVTLAVAPPSELLRFYENSDRSGEFPLPHTWTDPATELPKTLYVEGLARSTAVRDAELSATFLEDEFSCHDTLAFTVGAVAGAASYDTVEVRYKTFIAPDAVVTPPHPDLLDFFAGDNRWFGYDAMPSRSLQYTLVTVDPSILNGQSTSPTNEFGTTMGFGDHPDGSDVTSCAHCAESYGDWCLKASATAECIETAVAGQNGNILSIQHSRVSETEVKVQINLVGQNPCAADIVGPDAPPIDAHLTLHFRQLCTDGTLQTMEFRLYGTHDGFPWHELYINGTAVYTHDPCCTHEDPDSLFGSGDHNYETNDLCHSQSPPLNEWRQVPGLP